MRATIEIQLASKLDATLVKELLDAHAEAKRNFYLGGLRLSAVEGGRFVRCGISTSTRHHGV